MPERLLSYDPISGTETWHNYDPVTKETSIKTLYNRQQVTEQIDHNKRLANADLPMSGEMRWAARIPNEVWHNILITEGVDIYSDAGWPRMKKLLNDPDYRHFRIWPGRV